MLLSEPQVVMRDMMLRKEGRSTGSLESPSRSKTLAIDTKCSLIALAIDLQSF